MISPRGGTFAAQFARVSSARLTPVDKLPVEAGCQFAAVSGFVAVGAIDFHPVSCREFH